jgi:hypothetical protein
MLKLSHYRASRSKTEHESDIDRSVQGRHADPDRHPIISAGVTLKHVIIDSGEIEISNTVEVKTDEPLDVHAHEPLDVNIADQASPIEVQIEK